MASDSSFGQPVATVAIPPVDQLRIRILQLRDAALQAVGQYYRYTAGGAGSQSSLSFLRPPLTVLFQSLRAAIVRSDKEKGVIIKNLLNSKEPEKVLEAWELMDTWLDDKKITRVDTIADYDSTRAEEENKHGGL